jgi:hypothetical protein
MPPAAGDPYYAVTHNGLDAIIERLLEEAQMLLADQPADVDLASSRLDYMWKVRLAPAHLITAGAAVTRDTNALAWGVCLRN